jgi:hypothetical protein
MTGAEGRSGVVWLRRFFGSDLAGAWFLVVAICCWAGNSEPADLDHDSTRMNRRE